jgi:hypothetical protein
MLLYIICIFIYLMYTFYKFMYKFYKSIYTKFTFEISYKLFNNQNKNTIFIISEIYLLKSCIEYIDSLDISLKYKKITYYKYHYNFQEFKILRKNIDKFINNQDTVLLLYDSHTPLNKILYLNFPKDIKILIINTEQLTRYRCLKNLKNLYKIIKNLGKNIKLSDYSYVNVELLKNYDIKSNLIKYKINKNEIYNLKKKIDIVCIDFKNSSSIPRKYMYNLLTLNFNNVVNIKDWGFKRDELLFSSKILVNIHFDKNYTIFEEIRCNRCIFNKIIVISEYSKNWENFYLKNHMIFTDYSNIVEKVKDVLNNYNFYYNLLFNNMDFTIL